MRNKEIYIAMGVLGIVATCSGAEHSNRETYQVQVDGTE